MNKDFNFLQFKTITQYCKKTMRTYDSNLVR